jgi:hypothetical protein
MTKAGTNTDEDKICGDECKTRALGLQSGADRILHHTVMLVMTSSHRTSIILGGSDCLRARTFWLLVIE